MTRTITQRELRNDSGAIMRGLDEGERYLVTRAGVPVGELTPVRRARFVAIDAVLEVFRGAAPLDADRLRRDLDATVDQSVEPRG
jgi:antitoxin (DNA-binding transcriptional repressor) of toxin-antitoxin stability system